VQQLRLSILFLTAVSILAQIFLAPALAQSGRGRPRVPTPRPTAPEPEPVKIPAAAAIVRQEQLGNVSRFDLRSGMKVLISEQHSVPLVAVVAHFKMVSENDPQGLAGTAQLAQQIILNQSRLTERMRALGAIFEAHALSDSISFSAIVSTDKLDQALALMTGVLARPTFDAAQISRAARERLVVEKVFVAPQDYSIRKLQRLATEGQMIIGGEDLRSITPEQLEAFYIQHYKPENLVIALVGDTTAGKLIEVQKLYGSFGVKQEDKSDPGVKSKPARAAPRADKPATDPPIKEPGKDKPQAELHMADRTPAVPAPPRLRYMADRGDINESIVSVGFRVPGRKSKEWPAIEALSAIIGQGRASRLGWLLGDEMMIASRVWAGYVALADSGLLTIQMHIAPDDKGAAIDNAEAALFKELDRLRRETPSESEMTRARTFLEKRFVDRSDTYLERAYELARAEVTGNFRAAVDYRELIRGVSPRDVQQAAARFLTLDGALIHEFEPYQAPLRAFTDESFATTVRAWAPTLAQSVAENQVREADPKLWIAPVARGTERTLSEQAALESIEPLAVKDFSTYNGPRAYVREDHTLPKVTVAILFQGGRLLEEQSTSGTTELMLRSMLYGTARQAPAQLQQELEQLGADVELIVEPDFFGYNISVLSQSAERALRLVRDFIEEPALRDADIARALLGQIGAIRNARDNTQVRAKELMLQAIFPGHPYSLPPHGREEVVAKLGAEQLSEWHARLIKRQLPLVVIVGDTNGSALVSGQLAEGFRRRDLDKSLPAKIAQAAKPGDRSEQRLREHTMLSLGYAGPGVEGKDLPTIELLNAAIVEDQNLGPAIAFGHDALLTSSVAYIQMPVAPDDEQRARAALSSELERMSRAGLSATEMASARGAAIALYTHRLQTHKARALAYARAVLYQRPAAEVDSLIEQAAKLTPEDVKRVASIYFKPSAAFAGIVRGKAAQQPQTTPGQ
jgi:zinc protease